MGILTSELSRLAVHHLHKTGNTAADEICQHQSGVVAGREHHTVEQLADGILLTDMIGKSHHGALGIQPRQHIFFDIDHRTVEIGHMIGDHDIGHDFCGGGGIHPRIGAFFINDRSGIEVLEIDSRGHGLDVTAVVDRRSGDRRHKSSGYREEDTYNSFHNNSPIIVRSQIIS